MNKYLTFGIAAALMAFSLTAAESPAQFEEKIGSLIKENRTAGMAVVVVKGGKIIYEKRSAAATRIRAKRWRSTTSFASPRSRSLFRRCR